MTMAIESTPTIVHYKDGVEQARIIGYNEEERIQKMV